VQGLFFLCLLGFSGDVGRVIIGESRDESANIAVQLRLVQWWLCQYNGSRIS